MEDVGVISEAPLDFLGLLLLGTALLNICGIRARLKELT